MFQKLISEVAILPYSKRLSEPTQSDAQHLLDITKIVPTTEKHWKFILLKIKTILKRCWNTERYHTPL